MPAKKLKKEVVEEIKEEEEVEEVLEDPATALPVEDDDVAYEEDLEADETAGEEPAAGEWVDE